tara:strand:- start:306459 stop:307925 length:1467 start_codon:yes stop_codon:yes gene_type:complete
VNKVMKNIISFEIEVKTKKAKEAFLKVNFTLAIIFFAIALLNYKMIVTSIYWGIVINLLIYFFINTSFNLQGFSIKYYDGIPCSKKELLSSLILAQLLFSIPYLLIGFVIIALCAGGFFSVFDFKVYELFFILLSSIPVSILFTLSNIVNFISNPRIQASKALNPHTLTIRKIMSSLKTGILSYVNGLMWVFIFAVPCITIGDYFRPFEDVDYSFEIVAFGFLFIGIFFKYKQALNVWKDERFSFPDNKRLVRNLKISTVGFVLSMLILVVSNPVLDKENNLVASEKVKKIYKDITEGKKEVVDQIFSDKELVTYANKDGETFFHYALRKGHIDVVKKLSSHKIFLNERYYQSRTPLMIAVNSKRIEVVKHLLEVGSDPNETQEGGFSPLMLASKKCQAGLVDLLIEKGASLNAQDSSKFTASHYASKSKCLVPLMALHKSGASLELKNKEGLSSLDLLKKKNSKLHGEFKYYLDNYSKYLRNIASEK